VSTKAIIFAHMPSVDTARTGRLRRAFGWILIALAILGMPQMRFLTGRLAVSFGVLSSLALGLAGVAWLVGVKLFLLFF